MKNHGSVLVILIELVLTASTPAYSQSNSVDLVREGLPKASIVIAKDPTPSARLAALELQYHVGLITGAVLPIKTDQDKVAGLRILVGDSEAARKLGFRGDDFQAQEYLIKFLPDAIVLIGRDWQDTEPNRREAGVDTLQATIQSYRQKINYCEAVGRTPKTESEKESIELPGIFDDQSTCYAVYDFLERFCDVRWYGPTELNTNFVPRSTLTIGKKDVRRAPAFKHRHYTDNWSWPITLDQWNNPSQAAADLYARRMRRGGSKWAGNHSLYQYYDRFGKKTAEMPELFEEERPEYFAKGYPLGPNTQMCYTNPALIQQVTQDARDYFDGKGIRGNRQPALGDYFAIVPMDDARWCKCDTCQAVLAKDRGRIRGAHFSSGTASNYLFGFVNAVAKEVRKTHPDKFISTLAYHVYAYPPDFPLEPNVAVAPCIQVRNFWAPLVAKNDLDFYRQWVDRRDRPIHLWNYGCFPMELALNKNWNCFPGFSAHRIADLIKMYYRDGVQGVFLCGMGEQVDFYVMMKLYDDPSLDVDALLNEFFTRHFGAASEPMKQFYLRIESIFNDSNNYPEEVRTKENQFHQNEEIAWKYLGTEERMNELGALMSQAEQLAKTDLEKQRVALWKKGVWDYMLEGRAKYLEKTKAGKEGK